MKNGKSLIVTGMVVAAVMVAGVSVYAATDDVDTSTETVREKAGRSHKGQGNRGSRDYSAAVEAGILSQDEADDILAYLEDNSYDREAIKEEVDGMTKEEAKAYIEENYPKVDLVEEGLLSEEQVEELQALKPEKSDSDRGQKAKGGSKGNNFAAAVEAGILTEDEAEAISTYRDENKIDKEDLEDELEGLTREEAKAYMEENYPDARITLEDLVEEGLLTDDQVEAIEALREEAKASRGGRSSGEDSDTFNATGARSIAR